VAGSQHFEGDVALDQQVEQAGVIALVEDELSGLETDFGGHGGEARDVFGPESLGEIMLVEQAGCGFGFHKHLYVVV
jgi:hypothetical protein